MERIIVVVLIVNIIASIAYLISKVVKGQKTAIAITLFFLVCPLIGFLIYYLPLIFLKVQGKGDYDRDNLVKRLDVEKERVMPAVEKELNVIPVEDAMVISSNMEKRTLLLEQLKKDINTNYRVILPAGSDNDSESAHYVAAARMEVYRRKQVTLAAKKKEWEKEQDNQEKLKAYLDEMEKALDSNLLSDKEADVYKSEYCRIMENMEKEKNVLFTPEEYSCYLSYLVDLEQYTKAEAVWGNIKSENKNEKAYRTILQMYYNSKNEKNFYTCLEELKESKINLSADGLKLVRYWMERRPQ